MKKNKKKILTIGLLCTLTILGGVIVTSQNSNASKDKFVDGNFWTLPFGFNPQKSESAGDIDNLNLLSATLLSVNQNNELVNYAAKSIDISKDGKTYTIKLKDGLKYQDGTDVQAKDYKTAINLLVNPLSKSSAPEFVYDNIVGGKAVFDQKSNDVSGVKVLDAKTFEIKLLAPKSYFKSLLANPKFAPIKESELKNKDLATFGKDYHDVLSSGEYKVKDYHKEQYIEYEKNQTSLASDQSPKVLKFLGYNSDQVVTHIKDFQTKKINSIGKSQVVDKTLGYDVNKKAQNASLHHGVNYLVNNSLSKEEFSALNLALDKNLIVKKFFYNQKQIHNNFLPFFKGSSDKILDHTQKNNFNFDKAKAVKFSKKELTFKVYSSLAPSYQEFVKYAVNQWTKLGLKINVEKVPFGPASGLYDEHDKPRNFDLTLGHFGLDFWHPLGNYESFKSLAYWVGADYDKFVSTFEQAKNELSEQKQLEEVKEIEKILASSGKFVPLFQDETNQYVQKGGWKTISFGQLLRPSFWTKNEE